MTTLADRDWLLITAREVIRILTIIFVIAAAALLIAFVAILFAWPSMIDNVDAARTPEQLASIRQGLLLVLPLAALMIGIAVLFFRRLAAIIGSVGTGDPLTLENADRLRQMAWLTIAVQAIAPITRYLGDGLNEFAGEATRDFSLDVGALVLALMLFILARVFAQGAAMRAELEGTV